MDALLRERFTIPTERRMSIMQRAIVDAEWRKNVVKRIFRNKDDYVGILFSVMRNFTVINLIRTISRRHILYTFLASLDTVQ